LFLSVVFHDVLDALAVGLQAIGDEELTEAILETLELRLGGHECLNLPGELLEDLHGVEALDLGRLDLLGLLGHGDSLLES